MQITIVFPFRNRDSLRVKKALNSLMKQSAGGFRVLFVDYGSTTAIAHEVSTIVAQYDFVEYHYLFTEYQPWNKCKALNFAIKKISTEYCFVADIDMVFHPEFTSVLKSKISSDTVTYFKVGYLSKKESLLEKDFDSYNVNFYSNMEATGMSLFPVNKIKAVQGFDEFFHFWGAEDTDIHNRLKNYGCKVEFYDEKTLLLHQWHPNYRSREKKDLNKELQLTNVVELNHYHLKKNAIKCVTKLNSDTIMSELDYKELNCIPLKTITNEVNVIDHFLFVELHNANEEFVSVKIINSPFFNTFKFKIKKVLGKKVPKFYTLKEINDKLLLHIISFYGHLPYIYKISDDFKSIEFKIKK